MYFSPLTLAYRLRKKARKDYLDRFWSAARASRPSYSTEFPTSEEYKRVARAYQPYKREMKRLTESWLVWDNRLARFESWAFRRARRLRMSGKI
jgi:hypothetical protein